MNYFLQCKLITNGICFWYVVVQNCKTRRGFVSDGFNQHRSWPAIPFVLGCPHNMFNECPNSTGLQHCCRKVARKTSMYCLFHIANTCTKTYHLHVRNADVKVLGEVRMPHKTDVRQYERAKVPLLRREVPHARYLHSWLKQVNTNSIPVCRSF